jgi:spermidine synthase
MSSRQSNKTATAGAFATPNWLLLAAYIAAIFVSASLLFAVQPLFTKLVLPRLGGSPSVWSVAMVFFQAMLLAGYGYAHFLTRFLPVRYAVVIHVAVMLFATIALPLSIAESWGRPPNHGEALYLIVLFSVSVGLPFFALAANSPLLQAWLARTNHPSAKDPYFLYAAGNIGSFLALLSYPLIVEPFTLLTVQRAFWSYGFYLLIALIALCGALVWAQAKRATSARIARAEGRVPGIHDALTWTALAAVPSAFLIAVTSYISTDVGSTPLFWVIPLALYLATFVIVFQTRPLIPHSFALKAQPAAVALLVGLYLKGPTEGIFVVIAINIATFFVTALVCHGELARRRPAAQYLTAFYLWMSFGGMVGGMFAGLIAPNIFSWIAEYPLLIVAGLLCRPGVFTAAQQRSRIVWFAAFAVIIVAVALYVSANGIVPEETFMAVAASALLLGLILLRDSLKFAAVAGVLLLMGYINQQERGESVRNFFGVHKIYETNNGTYRVLLHGTTVHGAEMVSRKTVQLPGARPVPLAYYHSNSGLAKTVEAARKKKPVALNVAVIGLGTGALACYARTADNWTFYEIDQSIVDVASNPAYFTYKPICAPNAKLVLGDARLTITNAPNGAYDLIVVDAFSSDAIPIHLLTREAMAAYLAKLAPHGMIVLHISNRHLELASIVAGIAKANGLEARINSQQDEHEDSARYLYTSTVTAIARLPADFGSLESANTGWEPLRPDPKQWVWTDDYSNVIGAMIRHLRE